MIPTKYNIFDFDWYGRSNVVNTNTRYSSFLVNDDEAFEMCGEKEVNKRKLEHFLSNFNKGVLKKYIPLYINTNDDSYTDGRHIMVSSLNDFDNVEQNYYWRLDTIIGLALHEACHCIYSEFNGFKKFGKGNSTVKWILNVIEDEAIENSCKNRAGGYAKFLENVKYHYFDEKFDGNFNADNDFEEFSKIFINIIRYPKFIGSVMTQELKDKWGEVFFKIYNILNKYHSIIKVNGDISNYNTCNTNANGLAAIAIYALIKDFLKLDDDQMQQEAEQSMNKGNSAMGSNETGAKPLSSVEEQQLQEELNKLIEDSKNSSTSDDNKEENNNNENPIASKVDFMPSVFKKDITTYNMFYKWAYPHLQKATSIIYNKSYKLNYMRTKYNRNGQLDGSSIVSALAGNKFVCNQVRERKEVVNGKLAVVLMCDSSGSMSEYNARPIKTAGHFITLLSEAVKSVPGCEIYVYTHNNIIRRVVSDKEWNKRKQCIGDAFQERQCFSAQNEIDSYTKIIEDVRKQTKLPILAINFGDCEYGCSDEGIKQCVNNLKEEQKCIITMCSIGNEDKTESNNFIYGENNWVQISTLIQKDVVAAINELSSIIKKEYNKHK